MVVSLEIASCARSSWPSSPAIAAITHQVKSQSVEVEDVFDLAVEAFGPELRPRRGGKPAAT